MGKGIRRQIYIPSVEIWESIKKSADESDRSVSNYLINLHKSRASQPKEKSTAERQTKPDDTNDTVENLANTFGLTRAVNINKPKKPAEGVCPGCGYPSVTCIC